MCIKFQKKCAAFVLISFSLTSLSPVFANSTSPQDEVVYAVLNNHGAVQSLYGVSVIGDEGDKNYLQNQLNQTELPWLINASYKLDGKAIKPAELAGANGNVTLSLHIRQNPKANPYYYEHYSLQAVLSFPENAVKQLNAPEGTILYKGSERQIMYTLLPGQTSDFTVSMVASDFEMSPILLNAAPLHLSGDLPKSDELITELDALTTGVEQLKTGGQSIKDGSGKLHNNLSDAQRGALEVSKALMQLQSNSHGLKTGSTQLYSGLSEIQNKLASDTQKNQIGLLGQNNANMIAQLDRQIQDMERTIQSLSHTGKAAEAENLKLQVNQSMQIKALLEANQETLIGQSKGYADLADQIEKLAVGAEQLNSGLTAFEQALASLSDASSRLASGLSQILKGSKALGVGIQRLTEGIGTLNAEVRETSDSMDATLSSLQRIEAAPTLPPSFIETSGNAAHVQFAIRTEGIEQPEKTQMTTPPVVKKSFFEKLLALFK